MLCLEVLLQMSHNITANQTAHMSEILLKQVKLRKREECLIRLLLVQAVLSDHVLELCVHYLEDELQ